MVLKQRSRELARSNAELEQFAYVASHDLQEPLRMVASYMHLLERKYKDQLDADANEFIGFAVDGAKRMQALIEDLLAYSRVGTAAKPLQPTDCAAVVKAALSSVRVAIDESGAQVTCDTLPSVMGDATQLTQLFQNLIANAIKFRREESPVIQISAYPEAECWCFAVRDNGIGIEAEYFDRIFVMFQRLHGRRAYPGTGIGLAICKKIVERHGGRIWVESCEKGSVFKFVLPGAEGAMR
jgi:light-regulated signal transduction histidine kinase (bacteriophytochrome)